MKTTTEINNLAATVQNVARKSNGNASLAIEEFLNQALQDLSPDERISILEEVALCFDSQGNAGSCCPIATQQPPNMNNIAAILLGKDVVAADLSPDEISGRLAQSLNTIFDTLNEITHTIRFTLLGGNGEEEHTIRWYINSEINGMPGNDSIKDNLDQIRDAFLVAHKAFGISIKTLLNRFFLELNPEKFKSESNGSFNIGPLQKARAFDLYEEKFQACENALQSGRLVEEFMEEFEKICRKLYGRKMWRKP